MLYFVKFPDEGVYCAGPQISATGETIPGGPIGYELHEDAQTIADAIAGHIVEKADEYALNWCKTKGFVLWIKKANGGMGYIQETVPETPAPLIRVEGAEREAAIAASQTLSS